MAPVATRLLLLKLGTLSQSAAVTERGSRGGRREPLALTVPQSESPLRVMLRADGAAS
jgi:hypothetical protein